MDEHDLDDAAAHQIIAYVVGRRFAQILNLDQARDTLAIGACMKAVVDSLGVINRTSDLHCFEEIDQWLDLEEAAR